jgi:tRNA(Ile)-lysidine synthase TilS/MesJ
MPEFEMRKCEVCREPTSAKVCKSCELLEGLGLERRQKTLISH